MPPGIPIRVTSKSAKANEIMYKFDFVLNFFSQQSTEISNKFPKTPITKTRNFRTQKIIIITDFEVFILPAEN
jgi:hypothetical protein